MTRVTRPSAAREESGSLPAVTLSSGAIAAPGVTGVSVERSIVRTIAFAAVLVLLGLTKADPDLFGHVRFGGDILRSGIPTRDPYSFTSDIPWVNHEWLAEVVMWLAWAAGSGPGLVAMKLIVLAAVVWLAWSTFAAAGLPMWATEALLLVLVFGTWLRTAVIRPQLFSVLLFTLLAWILQSAGRGHPRRLFWLPPIFALWINLHGGWIVGYGVFGLWLILTVLAGRRPLPMTSLIGLGAACTVALLLNPYGAHMLLFIAETVRFDRSDIVDWQPAWHTGISLMLWSATAVTALFILVRRRHPVTLPHAAIAMGLGLAAVRVVRLDAFFAIAVVVLLGPALGESAGAEASPSHRRTERITLGVTMVLVAIAAASFARGPLSCVAMDAAWAPEREAGAFLQANRLKGRLVSWFDWGELAIWHFGPALLVSMDGRRETVYSAKVLNESDALAWRPDQNLSVLDAWNPDYAWLPKHLPLVRTLEARGWTSIFSGPVSMVLAREPHPVLPAAPLAGPGCFPGP
jgi:hypothetical protein